MGWWWWISSRSGWLLELLTELIKSVISMNLRAFVNGFVSFFLAGSFCLWFTKPTLGQVDATARRLRGANRRRGWGGRGGVGGGGGEGGGPK